MNSTAADSMRNPWLGLNAFTENLQEYFHGREAETDELFRRVKRKPLTVLFGQSGLGKTSLLMAGLFPRLRQDRFLPVAVRLDYSADAPALAKQAKVELARAIAAADLPALLPASPGETLWEYFHRRDRELHSADGRRINVVLVFDQFEELFTLGKLAGKVDSRKADFLTELADLVENRLPVALAERCEADEALAEQFDFERDELRVLLSLREDFLPHLESLRPDLPAVAENRMRLTRMNGEQALQAVLGPGRDIVSPEVGLQIVRFVAGGQAVDDAPGPDADEFAGLEIEPALLSLFCRELNDRRIAQTLPQITSDLLAGSRAHILEDFYERCVADQPPAVRDFVEDELLTESGYRESMALERARRALAQRGAPADAIDTLVGRRLLHIEERLHVQRIELTHDLLVDVVKSSRTRRQQREAARRGLRQWVREHRALVGAVVAGLAAMVAAIAIAVALFVANAWRHERAAREDAEQKEAQVETARQEAETQRAEADILRAFAEKQRTLAQRLQYASDINLAYQAFQENRPFRMRELLMPHEGVGKPHSFEWNYLWQLCQAKVVLGPPHKGPTRAVIFSPDGRRAASCGADGAVNIFDAATGQELVTPLGHQKTCNALAYSPDGKMLASAAIDDTVKVWDANTGEQLYVVHDADGTINGVAFSPDGRLLALAGTDNVVIVCDALTGNVQKRLTGHSDSVRGVAFSPDSKTLASCSDDKTVKLWDVAAGQITKTLTGHTGATFAVAFSPDGKLLATSDDTNFTIILWDLATFKQVRQFNTEHILQITAVGFSPDGRQIVSTSADGTARIRDLGSDKPGTVLYGPGGLLFGGSMSPDGTRLALGGDDGSVQIWDLTVDNFTQVRVWTVEKNSGLFLAQSPSGDRLAQGGPNGEVSLWDPTTGKKVQTLSGLTDGIEGVAFSPDGKWLAAGGDGKVAAIWDLASGKKLREFREHEAAILPVAYDPQGRFVATGDHNGVIKIWDPRDARVLASFEHPGRLSLDGLAFSSDGRRLASAGAAKQLVLWDTATWQVVRVWSGYGQGLNGVAYSPDNHRVATALTDGAVVVQDDRQDDPVFTLRGHNGRAIGLAFSPDGQELVCGGYDDTIPVWDLTTGQTLITLVDALGTSLVFNPDGSRLAAGSSGGVEIWYAANNAGALQPAGRWLSWYRTQVQDAEKAKQWFALAFYCSQLIKADPSGEAKYRRTRAWAAYHQKDWHQVIADLTQAMKLSDPTESDLFYRGWAYFDLDQYDPADADMTQALKMDPKDDSAWGTRGEIRADQRRWADAVADYTKSLELSDKEEVNWRLRGVARAELGQWDQAASDFAAALDRAPTSRTDLGNSVIVQLGRGDLPAYRLACARMYDRLSYTDEPENWNSTAWDCSLDPTDNVPPAQLVSLMDKAVAAQPKEYAFLNTRGAVLYRAGRYDDAIHQLNDAVAIHGHGGSFEDLVYLAMSQFRLGHADEARDALKRAVAFYEQGLTAQGPNARPADWSTRIEWQTLRTEAERMIPSSKP